MKKDPDQLKNVAADKAHAETLGRLGKQLTAELTAGGDPRHDSSETFDFDAVRYLGGAPTHPDFRRKKK